MLAATGVAGAWVCFKRTGVRSFLFLAGLLILWPWFESTTGAMCRHFLDQVMEGQRPWMFPFSLIVRGHEGLTGWEMTPGEFLTKFHAAKELLLFALLAIAFLLIARSLKRKQTEREVQ